MSSSDILGNGAPAHPGASADGRVSSVSADLQGIFSEGPEARFNTGQAANRHVRALTSGGRRRRDAGIAIIAVVAGMVGVAGGALGVKLAPGDAPPPAVVSPTAPSVPSPVVAPSAIEETHEASPPAPAPVPAASVAPRIAPAAARQPVTPPVKHARQPVAPPVKHARHVVSVVRRPAAGCGRDARGCSYRAVLNADQRLRSVYSRAIRAGVPRAVLVDYRNRWARLRYQHASAGRVIAEYAALERGLAREMAQDRDGRSPREWDEP